MSRGMHLSPEARAAELEVLREVARSEGGACLSKVYVNQGAKLPWRCALGHEWEAMPRNVKHGTWCPECAYQRRFRRTRARKPRPDRRRDEL